MAFRCNPSPEHYGYLYFGTEDEAKAFGVDHYGRKNTPHLTRGWYVEAIDRAINAIYQNGELRDYRKKAG